MKTESTQMNTEQNVGWFKQNYVALTTIWIKECTRFLRIWVQTLVPPAITMSLYFVIFGSLIGNRIGEMGGFTYMKFIVPGLIMMSVITNSYANVSSSFFSAKFQRNIEELLVSPVPTSVIILGYVGGGVARAILIGIIVTLVSLFFVDVQIHHLGIIAITLLLTSTLFATAGLINAVFAKTFDDISVVPTFVLTPLTYLGGVFYSLTLLPEFWQWVSKANPVVYMVNGFRYGFLGVSDVDITLFILGHDAPEQQVGEGGHGAHALDLGVLFGDELFAGLLLGRLGDHVPQSEVQRGESQRDLRRAPPSHRLVFPDSGDDQRADKREGVDRVDDRDPIEREAPVAHRRQQLRPVAREHIEQGMRQQHPEDHVHPRRLFAAPFVDPPEEVAHGACHQRREEDRVREAAVVNHRGPLSPDPREDVEIRHEAKEDPREDRSSSEVFAPPRLGDRRAEDALRQDIHEELFVIICP